MDSTSASVASLHTEGNQKLQENKQQNIIITTTDHRVPESHGMTITLQKIYNQSQHKLNMTTSVSRNSHTPHPPPPPIWS